MIFLINQLNQIQIFFVQKSHHTNFLHDWWVGYPPSPRPSPFNLHPVLYILNTFMHCQIVMRIQKHRQTDRWYFRKMANSFLMCVFKFIHSCVWKGCVISCVFISYVSSNPLPKKKHSHIGRICLTFLHCVFSNVFSKILHRRMQSHIGCIYLTFLHCAFSNVSSIRLHEQRQSHIGYICLAFLHCVFSNVSSNGLPEKMHSHIGCICLTFPNCAFSNVSPNHLHEKRHSHIGRICLTFLHCAFSNVSSNCLSLRMHCICCI